MVRAIDVVRAVVAPLTRTRVLPALGARRPAVGRAIRRPAHRWPRAGERPARAVARAAHRRGEESGQPRDAPLMYTPDGHGRAIVAGTNFAGERHPAWTTNLMAHPDAAITVRGRRLRVRAIARPRRRARRGLGAHRAAVARIPRLRARLRPHGAAVPPAADRGTTRLRAAAWRRCAGAPRTTARARRSPRSRPSRRPSWSR